MAVYCTRIRGVVLEIRFERTCRSIRQNRWLRFFIQVCFNSAIFRMSTEKRDENYKLFHHPTSWSEIQNTQCERYNCVCVSTFIFYFIVIRSIPKQLNLHPLCIILSICGINSFYSQPKTLHIRLDPVNLYLIPRLVCYCTSYTSSLWISFLFFLGH